MASTKIIIDRAKRFINSSIFNLHFFWGMMQTDQAIKAFSQSEKIKAGLIWATQIAEVYLALPESEKAGAERILKTLIGMIASVSKALNTTSRHVNIFISLSQRYRHRIFRMGRETARPEKYGGRTCSAVTLLHCVSASTPLQGLVRSVSIVMRHCQ